MIQTKKTISYEKISIPYNPLHIPLHLFGMVCKGGLYCGRGLGNDFLL